ncbi:MAG: energy transducer TonB [Acidobacteriia bacterium]|nr:energy transducer TonB [Terriglobia bacterium]
MRAKFLIAIFTVILSIPRFAVAQDESPKDVPPPQGGDFSSNPDAKKVPQDVILVKGAVPSASDSTTPLPEGGTITEKIYANAYFGMAYALPAGWRQKFVGPPPSDSGYFVLAQIEPGKTFKGAAPGAILISAQDMFFNLSPATTALDLINFRKSRLLTDYKVERQPTEVKIANRSFVRMDYMSPIAELHWYTLATQIRCHAVEFLLTSRDPALLESLVKGMDTMVLPEEAAPATGRGGGAFPVCIKGYASPDNMVHKVDPVFTERKFNSIPVRIVIDKYGKVKHVHVLSAFPDQSKAVTDALLQWEFRPHRVNGQAVEVETGIVFGAPQRPAIAAPRATAARD